jgi:hypothetical protein
LLHIRTAYRYLEEIIAVLADEAPELAAMSL